MMCRTMPMPLRCEIQFGQVPVRCGVLLSRSSQRYAVYAYVFNEHTIVSMIFIAALYVRKYECMYVCRYVLSPRSLYRASNIL